MSYKTFLGLRYSKLIWTPCMQFPYNFYVFYIGMNSIVLYLGHYVAWQMGPFNYISGPMNTHWDNLVESIWSVSAWLIVAYVMYRKKVFITV